MTRRPDALGSWSGPLDCENQDLIHSQCQEQAGMYIYSVHVHVTLVSLA